MSLSFWMFLLGSVIALIYTSWDHGEVWDEFQTSKYPQRAGKLLKLVFLWAIPVAFLTATIFSGVESKQSDGEVGALTESVGWFSNSLNTANSALSVQSNHVEQIETIVRNQSNKLASVGLSVTSITDAAAPRSISLGSQTEILNAVQELPKTKVIFVFPSQDLEAKSLVGQIAWPLDRAGFPLGDAPIQLVSSKIYRGISVYDCTGTNAALVGAIVSGLKGSGYLVSTNQEDTMGARLAGISKAGILISVAPK
jgi:hypothetical protein